MNALWKLLWASLLSFLALRVDEGGDDEGGEDAGGAGDAGEGDNVGDDEGAGEEGGEDAPTGLSFDEVLEAAEDALPRVKGKDKQAKPDAHRLEVELAEERGRRMALESRPAPAAQPAPQYRDLEAEREDAEVRAAQAAGEDPDKIAMRVWTNNANRALRNQHRETNQIRLEARDNADRAEFGRLEITNPKAFKRYADEVERLVATARSNGQAVPRKMVMQTLIGRDFLEGKIKPKTSRARASSSDEAPRVNRGSMPNTRSDVGRGSSGKLTPGQAAAKRLKNIHI
jgi:hypothetical protein